MRRWIFALFIGLATALGGVLLALTPLGFEFEKNVGLPWLFSIRGPVEAPRDVVVVAIDERTGGHLGLPSLAREWPRSIHARLIESLVKRGASVIAFDMSFHLSRSARQDQAFAEAVGEADRVVLFQKLDGKRRWITDRKGRRTGWVWAEELHPPVPPLAAAAKSLAPWSLPKQQVAVYQFWTFKPSVGDAPTMPVAALQLHASRSLGQWLKIFEQVGAPSATTPPESAGEPVRAPDVRRQMGALRGAFTNDPGLQEGMSLSMLK